MDSHQVVYERHYTQRVLKPGLPKLVAGIFCFANIFNDVLEVISIGKEKFRIVMREGYLFIFHYSHELSDDLMERRSSSFASIFCEVFYKDADSGSKFEFDASLNIDDLLDLTMSLQTTEVDEFHHNAVFREFERELLVSAKAEELMACV
jgi:hypothetical protein